MNGAAQVVAWEVIVTHPGAVGGGTRTLEELTSHLTRTF